MATCFLDCEFTNFETPALLSLGLVDLSGIEYYSRSEQHGSLCKFNRSHHSRLRYAKN